jgi:hypothetical protein
MNLDIKVRGMDPQGNLLIAASDVQTIIQGLQADLQSANETISSLRKELTSKAALAVTKTSGENEPVTVRKRRRAYTRTPPTKSLPSSNSDEEHVESWLLVHYKVLAKAIECYRQKTPVEETVLELEIITGRAYSAKVLMNAMCTFRKYGFITGVRDKVAATDKFRALVARAKNRENADA